jgi:HAD superfamily hydrolase (TIGR01456 family)
MAARRIGVSFDIDGVLLRGSKPLERARDSLLRLKAAKVPYIFLTNGGGELEAVKAKKLSEVLELPVDDRQVILSHTPLRPVVAAHAHQKILVLGCRDVVSVAKGYGARRVYEVKDLAHDDPYRYPFLHWEHRPLPARDREEPFGAVFILHDPNNWGAELQITLDVIRGGVPLGAGQSAPHGAGADATQQTIPVYASNPDLVFAGVYPVPRLAGGAFTRCLETMFAAVTGGQQLVVTQCGKPTPLTFDCAARQLAAWRALQGGGQVDVADARAAQGAGSGFDADRRICSGAAGQQTAAGQHVPSSAAAAATGSAPSASEYHQPGSASCLASAAATPNGTADHTASSAMHHAVAGLPPFDASAHFDALYHIGDNPSADIRGALNAGGPWQGILVRTGVFTGAGNDANHPAHLVTQGVGEAVDHILQEAALR